MSSISPVSRLNRASEEQAQNGTMTIMVLGFCWQKTPALMQTDQRHHRTLCVEFSILSQNITVCIWLAAFSCVTLFCCCHSFLWSCWVFIYHIGCAFWEKICDNCDFSDKLHLLQISIQIYRYTGVCISNILKIGADSHSARKHLSETIPPDHTGHSQKSWCVYRLLQLLHLNS